MKRPCMCVGPKAANQPRILFGVTNCAHCESFNAMLSSHHSCSLTSVEPRLPPTASTGWSSERDNDQVYHSKFTHTCSDIARDTSLPVMVMIHEPFRTTLGTGISATLFDIRNSRR